MAIVSQILYVAVAAVDGGYRQPQHRQPVLRRRAEMLDITAEQFAAVGDAFDAILAQGYLCAVGNEKNIADNGELFDNLVTIN